MCFGPTLLLAERREAPADLLKSNVLLVGRQSPYVSKRVLKRPRSVAIELIRHRFERLSPGRKSLAELCIHIFDVEQDAHRNAAQRLRTSVPHLRELVSQHNG